MQCKAIDLSDKPESPIETMEKSKQRFLNQDRVRASVVCRFQHVAGHPSDSTMIYAAATNSIKNNPITQRDVEVALEMLGKSEHALQGKTTRTQPEAVTEQLVDVPTTIMDYYRNVELSIDVMHMNQVPFLVSVSKHIHYATVEALDDMKIPTLESGIKRVISTYRIRGFNIVLIHVDIQFKAIKDRKSLGISVNVVSKEEHVPEIERLIRVIKERARCYYSMLPYRVIPCTMIVHLLITVVFYISTHLYGGEECHSSYRPSLS